jgi:hypothetical protein
MKKYVGIFDQNAYVRSAYAMYAHEKKISIDKLSDFPDSAAKFYTEGDTAFVARRSIADAIVSIISDDIRISLIYLGSIHASILFKNEKERLCSELGSDRTDEIMRKVDFIKSRTRKISTYAKKLLNALTESEYQHFLQWCTADNVEVKLFEGDAAEITLENEYLNLCKYKKRCGYPGKPEL